MTLGIDDADVAGAGQFQRTIITELARPGVAWLAWRGYREGLRDVDESAARCKILAVEQSSHRDVYKVAIRGVTRPIRIGQALGFGDQMHTVHGQRLVSLEVKVLQDAEDL
jgi:hypothetical protein